MGNQRTKAPRNHTQEIKNELTDLIITLREGISELEDPQAQALFETSAEVLTGLKTAFSHYEQQFEAAWRQEQG